MATSKAPRDAGADVRHRRPDPRMLRSRSAAIAATLELLTERGIAATTIEAVAERSGVAKTTIYRQWEGQTDLVLDTFASVLHPPSDPDTGTLRDDLMDLARGLATALTAGPACGLMLALIDASQRDPSYAALHRREAQIRHDVIRTVIIRGIERGELPSGTDPAEVLDMIAGPLFHRRVVSQVPLDADFAAHVVDLVLTTYRTRPSSERAPEAGDIGQRTRSSMPLDRRGGRRHDRSSSQRIPDAPDCVPGRCDEPSG